MTNHFILIIAILLVVGGIAVWKLKMNKEKFFFEVTPQKKCQGGQYMRQSNVELQNYCNSLTPEQNSYYNCNKLFNGSPVHFEYSPLSNDYWQNDWRM